MQGADFVVNNYVLNDLNKNNRLRSVVPIHDVVS